MFGISPDLCIRLGLIYDRPLQVANREEEGSFWQPLDENTQDTENLKKRNGSFSFSVVQALLN